MSNKKHEPIEPISPYYANELINHFRLTGSIVAMDRRRSGTTVVTIQAGSTADQEVEGSGGERLFTSRFLVRVPPRLKAKWPDRLLRQSPSIVTVTGRIHGTIEVIEGRQYLMQELVAQDIQFIARFGTVATHPMHWLKPFDEAQSAPSASDEGDTADKGEDKAPDESEALPSANPAAASQD